MSKPDYLISTPENVDLHLELAGLGNRILASLIDTLLTWAILLLILLSLGLTLGLLEAAGLPEGTKTAIYYGVVAVGILLFLTILFGYYMYFEGTWQGQTPGKKVARIRVIEQSGQSVGWPSVIIRNLIRPVDMGVMLIGLISMVLDRNERRLGDLAAGTMVIRERHPSEGARELKLTATLDDRSFVDIGRMTPVDYDLLISFLGRRELLSHKERPAIAHKLADYFRDKLLETTSQDEPETFLEKLYLSYQARAEQASA
jgi:uncharacterized RDD family membrane protein YckC